MRTTCSLSTDGVHYIPFAENGTNYRDEYECISASRVFSNYSVEELRVADYNQGKGSARAGLASSSFWAKFAVPQPKTPSFGSEERGRNLSLFVLNSFDRHSADLDRLRGSGIEVVVGSTSPYLAQDESVTWSLPQSLISHYSPFLKAACSHDFKERQEKRIELPEDNHKIFGLFVEWMYYGNYSVELPISWRGSEEEDVNVEAQCWVLGDKLLCNEFKNFAMSRLYAQYMSMFASRMITTHDVRYVCENSAADSKLRQFYLALVVQNFADPTRLNGTTEEWNELLMNHPDTTLLLLQKFRGGSGSKIMVKEKESYMDQNEPLSKALEKMKVEDHGA